ncbi:hypothetical protein FQZ97_1004260 [compost metagenome]
MAVQVALTRDKRRVGLPSERFRRIGDIDALAIGEPVDLQHQFPGVHRRTWASLLLDAVEQLTQRDRLDFIEVQLPERTDQDAVIDRTPQSQCAVRQALGTALGVGLELKVPGRPAPEVHSVGDFAALLDLGPGG